MQVIQVVEAPAPRAPSKRAWKELTPNQQVVAIVLMVFVLLFGFIAIGTMIYFRANEEFGGRSFKG